tara:strand:- start:713 stop:1054 length:342 start_codon:yes stop_codon:yes gene_type:complete
MADCDPEACCGEDCCRYCGEVCYRSKYDNVWYNVGLVVCCCEDPDAARKRAKNAGLMPDFMFPRNLVLRSVCCCKPPDPCLLYYPKTSVPTEALLPSLSELSSPVVQSVARGV